MEEGGAEQCGTDKACELVFGSTPHEHVLTGNGGMMHMSEAKFMRWLYTRQISCESSVMAFYVFPSNEHEIKTNEFLWKAVNQAVFDSASARKLLKKNLLWLNVPKDLQSFLRSVDLDGMRQCILDILSIVLDLEDRSTVEVMRDLIAPSIWSELPGYLERKRNGEPTQPQSNLLDDIIENNFGDGEELEEDDGASQWVVQISGATFIDEPTANIADNFQLWKLYADWVALRVLICNRLGHSSRTASSCVRNFVQKKKRRDVQRQVKLIRKLSTESTGMLATLPVELIRNNIVPNLVLCMCSSEAPTHVDQGFSRQLSADTRKKAQLSVLSEKQ
eukprot:Plantae.Rhodophyta-Purpureofilum_apyrenoidigerum.ctg21039.p1 GENE.Plantae.Rhodophyta-Purpureofilum_apyrenoidigerum.ctg21039~~Plantae.Rhodophyta-Purpureofilum_apyrenoidigerum.ctg21039.p1  ORF type:complete len:334 (+),score=68.87 Plantae.Rhodophyta-Purpureofilum_apyrenoidigerum.ctg21039:152-1153(+)